jgi:hypothetical protein
VLWIRNGSNADPDPAFYLHANPDPGSKEQNQCGSMGILVRLKRHKQLNFCMKNLLKTGNKSKAKVPTKNKSLFERQ